MHDVALEYCVVVTNTVIWYKVAFYKKVWKIVTYLELEETTSILIHHSIAFKGTISDHQFQTSLFFQTPRFFFFFFFFFFCIFREDFTVMTYLYNNSVGNSMILERDNSLSLGIITGDN